MGKNPLSFVPVTLIKLTVSSMFGFAIFYIWLRMAVSEAAAQGTRETLGSQIFIWLVIVAFFLASIFMGEGLLISTEDRPTTINILDDKTLIIGMMTGSILLPIIMYFVNAQFSAIVKRLSKDCMRRINELSDAAKIN